MATEPATLKSLHERRAEAGSAYAAAAAAFADAWAELLAIDMTLSNRNVRLRKDADLPAVRFDTETPPVIPTHREFLSQPYYPGTLSAAAHKRHEELLRGLR